MMRLLISTAAIALVTEAAAAEGLKYGQLSFDRTSYASGDDELDVSELNGEVEFQTGSFLINGGVENVSADLNGVEGSLRELAVGAGFFAAPEVLVGLSARNIDNDVEDQTVAGGFAQYDNGQVGAGIRVLQNFDSEETFYLGVAEFTASPGFDIGIGVASNSEDDGTGFVLSTEYDAGPIDVRGYFNGNSDSDANIFGARGAFEFAGAFRGTAAFENLSGGDVDATSYNVGAGYQLVEGAWIDAAIGQIDRDGLTAVDTLQLSISFETGTQIRLDRAFEQDLREDFRSGTSLFGNTLSDLQ